MYRIPRYPNSPLTFIGLELDEVAIGLFGAIYAFAIKHISMLLVIAVITALYVKIKRMYPPGFFKHLMYMASMFELDFYPDCQMQVFIE